MKKQILSIIIGTIVLTFLFGALQAQTVTLTFTGKDANNQYVQLNRVSITNLTKGWQETIYWPDTTFTMQNTTGIGESVADGGFGLSQNNPNPFTGTTDVNLTVANAGAVTLEIADGNGRIAVETRHGTSLQPSSTTTNPFNFGDQMEYVGYATINGTEVESQHITQTQDSSQNFAFQFSITQQNIPIVITSEVVDITGSTAVCGGNVTSNGGSYVHTRGVCWSRFTSPTTNGTNSSHTTNGSGTGSFTSNITGLLAGTTYYVRAYAINNVGTGYGEEISFTTSNTVPTVSTGDINDITDSSAICGGHVFSDGGEEVTARGVCWSTSPNPTIEDAHTTDSIGIGSFNSVITGLTGSTQYYVRAYATNNRGTGYGNVVNFITKAQPCRGTPTVTDICGNTYNTVQIGMQCWMKENLRTIRYSDSTVIMDFCDRCKYNAPNCSSSNTPNYGLLYSWEAVMHGASSSSANPSGVQGVCPQGWHVPSNSEWRQLREHIRSQSHFFCNANNDNIAKALADSTGWQNSTATCSPGNTLSNNNASGFGVRPAGSYSFYHHTCQSFRSVAYFWTSTYGPQNAGYHCEIHSSSPNFSSPTDYIAQELAGYSVRCIKD